MASIYYRQVALKATHPKQEKAEKEEKQRNTIRMTKSAVTKDGKKIVTRMKRK